MEKGIRVISQILHLLGLISSLVGTVVTVAELIA